MNNDEEENSDDISLIRLLLAEKLDMSQDELSQTEQELNLYLATLSKYIADTGGELKIQAVFSDKTIEFEDVSTFLAIIEKNSELKPMTGEDIIALRKREGVSQSALGRAMYLPAEVIEDWEDNNKQVKGSALTLLNIIDKKGIEFLL